jgi:ribose transport system substrate-binding protein
VVCIKNFKGEIKMHKKIKHLLAYSVVTLMVSSLFLVGCSSKTQDTTSKPSDTSKKYTIGFSNYSLGNSWRVQMEAEFKAEADKLKSEGVVSNVIMTNSNGDISKQIADVKDLITKKVDAIVITASSPSALSPVCEEAISKGIVVISFDNYVDTNKVTAKVGINETEFGKTNAQFIVDKLNGKGNIVMLNGIAGTGTNALRNGGAMEVFNKYPNIKILGQAYADWDYAKGKSAVESFLAAYPKIDGVWSQGGAMTQAALDAFIAAGRPLVPMAGEANNGLLKEWKTNQSKGFDSIAPGCPTYVSASALDTAIDALKGKKVEKQVYLDVPAITSANLDKYVRTDLPDSFWNVTKLSDTQIKSLFSK